MSPSLFAVEEPFTACDTEEWEELKSAMRSATAFSMVLTPSALAKNEIDLHGTTSSSARGFPSAEATSPVERDLGPPAAGAPTSAAVRPVTENVSKPLTSGMKTSIDQSRKLFLQLAPHPIHSKKDIANLGNKDAQGHDNPSPRMTHARTTSLFMSETGDELIALLVSVSFGVYRCGQLRFQVSNTLLLSKQLTMVTGFNPKPLMYRTSVLSARPLPVDVHLVAASLNFSTHFSNLLISGSQFLLGTGFRL